MHILINKLNRFFLNQISNDNISKKKKHSATIKLLWHNCVKFIVYFNQFCSVNKDKYYRSFSDWISINKPSEHECWRHLLSCACNVASITQYTYNASDVQ